LEVYGIIDLYSFLTTGRRSSAACGCMKDNLPCTTMCQCRGCTNNQEQELPKDEIDDSSSEQEDDEYLKIKL
jgi:hypothetical protein